MRLTLTPTDPLGKVISFTLRTEQRVTLGRGAATVQISDDRLSRQHCAFSLERGTVYLEDLKSTNNTFLNGMQITKAPVANGDQVAFGSRVYRLRVDAREDLPDTPTKAVPTAVLLESELRIKFDLRESTLFAEGPEPGQAPLAPTRAIKDLTTIYRIGNLLNAEHDLERMWDLILSAILEVVPADRAALLLHDPSSKALYPRAWHPRPLVHNREGLGFSKTVANDCFHQGLSILTYDAQADSRFKGHKSIVDGKIRSVICVPVQSMDKVLGVIYLDTLAATKPFHRQDLDLISAVGLQAGTAIQRAQLMEELRYLFYDTVQALVAAVEAKDAYTKGHSERVAAIAVKTARHLALSSEHVQLIHLSGLLHDIGKIGVHEQILNKQGKLTPGEWQLVCNHPHEGARIVKNVRNTAEVVLAIRHHHENWDGTGYPDHLKGEQIPLAARILAIADGFDAMTSARSYRPAMSESQAIHELKNWSARRYDPRIVEAFIYLHGKGAIDLKALYLFHGPKIEGA